MRLVGLIKVGEETIDVVTPILRGPFLQLSFSIKRTRLLDLFHFEFEKRAIFGILVLKIRKAPQKGLLDHFTG